MEPQHKTAGASCLKMKTWFGGEAASGAILLLSSKPREEAAASDQHTNDTQARQHIEHSPKPQMRQATQMQTDQLTNQAQVL